MPTWEEDFQRLMPITKDGYLQPVADEVAVRNVVLSADPTVLTELQTAARVPAGSGAANVRRAYDAFSTSFVRRARGAMPFRSAPEQVAGGFARGLEAIAYEAARHGDLKGAKELVDRACQAILLTTEEIPGLDPRRNVNKKEQRALTDNRNLGTKQLIIRCHGVAADQAANTEQKLLAVQTMSRSAAMWGNLGLDVATRWHCLAVTRSVVLEAIEHGSPSTRQHAIEFLTRTSNREDAGKTRGRADFLKADDLQANWTVGAQLTFLAQCHRAMEHGVSAAGISLNDEHANRVWIAHTSLQLLPEWQTGRYPVMSIASGMIGLEPSGGPMTSELAVQASELCTRLQQQQSLLPLGATRAPQLATTLAGLTNENQVILGVAACALNAQLAAYTSAKSNNDPKFQGQWAFHTGQMFDQLAQDLRSGLTHDDQNAMRTLSLGLLTEAQYCYQSIGNMEMVEACKAAMNRSVDRTLS